MNWNKLKKEIEGFLSPSLLDRVNYLSSGYRYAPDKKTQCYLVVDKKEVFNTKTNELEIKWYQTEQEIKNDASLVMYVSDEDIAMVRKGSNGKIPEARLRVIAKNNKLTAQNNLHKSDFQKTVSVYLTTSIEKNLESDDILLNIMAIMDRRVGKKRLSTMAHAMGMKHPVVQYFYEVRRQG